MNNRANIGKIGENKACEYLVKNGYKILKRNWREKWDEIDIIAKQRSGTIVFFEVKTLENKGSEGSGGGLMPEDNMTKSKISKISRACLSFAAKNENLINEKKGWRLDLLSLTINGKDTIIKHYENVAGNV